VPHFCITGALADARSRKCPTIRFAKSTHTAGLSARLYSVVIERRQRPVVRLIALILRSMRAVWRKPRDPFGKIDHAAHILREQRGYAV
jgi:hypothetical protein